jgi:hypothetical protein
MLIKAARCSVMISAPQFNRERAQIVENLQELRRVQSLRELLRGDSTEGAGDATLKFDEFRQNELLEIVERGEHASAIIDVLGNRVGSNKRCTMS